MHSYMLLLALTDWPAEGYRTSQLDIPVSSMKRSVRRVMTTAIGEHLQEQSAHVTVSSYLRC